MNATSKELVETLSEVHFYIMVVLYQALCELRWLVISFPAAEIVVVFGQDWSYRVGT